MNKSKAFTGIIWSSFQRFGTMIVSFISNLVLARLLTPRDFGTIGMLLFFINVANVFIDGGFGSALIQKKKTTNSDYSSIFILNIAISILLYFTLFISAPSIARFYDTEILTILLRVEGLVLIGNALCMIQTSILRKNMNFKKLATANLIGNSIGSIAAICSAIVGFGIWSLVIRVLCVSYITSACLWAASDWKPSLKFEFSSVKNLFGFGSFILLSTSLSVIATNLQTLVIGKIFYQRTLGLYTQALQLRNVAADSLQNIVGQVLFPDYAKITDDLALSNKLNNSFYIISYFTIALLILLIAIAKPLIVLLYSSKWIDAVPYFQILCIGGIFYAIQDVNYHLIAAKGKSKVLFYINLLKIPPYICALYICGKYGSITYVLYCIVAYSIVSYIIFAIIATKTIKTSIYPQLINLLKSIFCATVAVLPLLALAKFISFESNLLEITAYSISYICTFCLISFILNMYPFKYVLQILSK